MDCTRLETVFLTQEHNRAQAIVNAAVGLVLESRGLDAATHAVALGEGGFSVEEIPGESANGEDEEEAE